MQREEAGGPTREVHVKIAGYGTSFRGFYLDLMLVRPYRHCTTIYLAPEDLNDEKIAEMISRHVCEKVRRIDAMLDEVEAKTGVRPDYVSYSACATTFDMNDAEMEMYMYLKRVSATVEVVRVRDLALFSVIYARGRVTCCGVSNVPVKVFTHTGARMDWIVYSIAVSLARRLAGIARSYLSSMVGRGVVVRCG